MSNKISGRLLDLVLLGALVSGDHNARIFAFVVIAIMAVIMFLGMFGVDVAMAEKLRDRTLAAKVIATTVFFLYVSALIYSGFPVLAAIYACVAAGIRCAVDAKLNPQVKS